MSAEEAQCQSIFSYYQYGRFDDLGSTEWSLEPSSGSSFQMIDVLQENVDSPRQTYIYQHQPNDDYLLDSIGAGFDSPSSLNGYWPGLDDSQLRQECEPASTPSTAPQVSRRPNQKGPYPCIICFEQYKTLEALEQHAKSEAHRVYRCPVLDCPKTFYRRDSYARHKSQHTASETQVCSWCFKSFKRKDHLDQHVRKLHTAEYARHSSRTVQHGADVPDARTQAVKDLKRACCSMYPDDADALQELQECLNITDDSTSEEVAKNVVEILLRNRKSR